MPSLERRKLNTNFEKKERRIKCLSAKKDRRKTSGVTAVTVVQTTESVSPQRRREGKRAV